MVDGLRKAGLTAAKTVGEFVGIGRTKQQDIETKDAIAEITQTIEVPKLQTVKVKEEVIETKTEQVSPTVNKITDVGEKIGGARKDLAEKLGSVTSEDIKSQPLSKVFPKPDFDKLISEKGISKDVAILLNYLYSKIPSKPRKPYQVSRWVDKVNEVIDIYRNILEEEGGSRFAERVIDGLRKSSTFQRDYNIYSAIINQLGFGFNPGTLEIKEFSRAGDGKKTFTIVNGRYIVKDYDTLEEAVNGLGQIVDAKKDKPKETKFDIYQDTKTKEYFVGKKGATGVNRIAEGFKTLKEAREFLKINQNQLQETWDALRDIPTERRKENRDRKGIDWRKGKNVDAEEFRNTFGFRGVEFGNWVNQNERQQSINKAYDALMDLASVLKLSPKSISLGGELGFAFGARGSGKYNAHYEPDKIVINLTKTKGAGSVAHEWWHGIDNYFSRKRGVKTGYVTESPTQRYKTDYVSGLGRVVVGKDESIRPEMIDAFKGVVDAIRNSKLPERSKDLDKGRSNVYWSTPIEMTARAFENFVIEKLAQTGYVNDYLANLKSVDEWIKDSKGAIDATKNYPYPLADETHSINEAYQNFFDTIQEREEDGKSILFQDANGQYRVAAGERFIEALKDFSKAKNKRQATVAIMHEIMHPTVETIITGAKEGNAVGQKHTKTIVEEYNKANPDNKVTEEELIADNDKFVNGETTDKYRAVQEFIAEQWERYHQEGGKGFSEAFQKVLDQITQAFKAVYKSLTGEELTPELRKMFDDILGKEELSTDETTPTKEVSNEGNSASRDVESTAKALEGVDVKKIAKGTTYFHGTSLPRSESDFTKIDTSKGRGVRSNAFMGTFREQKSPFFFITSEESVANDFANAKRDFFNDETKPKEKHTSRIIPFAFNEKDAKVLDLTGQDYEFVLEDIGFSPIDFFGMGMYEQDQMWEMLDAPEFAEKLKELGYDAVKYVEPKRGVGIAVLNTAKLVNLTSKGISEAYHKAKADGSNPELVKAVEDLLGKPKAVTPNVEDWSRDVESTAKALEGKDVSDIDKKIEKVYHGTSYDIEKPTIEKYGQVHEMGGMLGKAVYYTPSVEEAKYFADLSKNKNKNGIKKVIEGVLNAKNIISVTDLVKNVKDEVLQKWITDNGKNYINPSDVKNRINIESNEKELTRWLSSIGDISELAKMNGNDAVTWGYENGKPNEIAIVDDNLVETNKAKYISEAYHKAKADGSNPELVKSVEDLLGGKKGQPKAEEAIPALKDVESTAKALEGLKEFKAESDRYFEYVPIEEIEKYKEFDRATEKKWGSVDNTLEELVDDIQKNGIKTPITLQVDRNNNALVVEGNTRLAAAKKLGIKNIPVRIISGEFGSINKSKAKKIGRKRDLGEMKVFYPDVNILNQKNSPAKFGFTSITNTKNISEAYHKAKADGSNPELVKAVEDLPGKPKAVTPNVEDWSKDVESTAKALEGVDTKYLKTGRKRIS